MDMSVSQPLYS